MFATRITTPSNHVPLFEWDYDSCMTLAHAVERFPSDVVSVEVYNTDTLDTTYKWESPDWAE